jgi:methylated-DNA-[protein]-cysteine S-methyltransferase
MTTTLTAPDSTICRTTITTPLGVMVAQADDTALQRLDFVDEAKHASQDEAVDNLHITQLRGELDRYFAGEAVEFLTPLAPKGTAFQTMVWNALLAIPCGETRSYAQLATAIGRPTACRAVAQANARNPISILIPCHRVIGADGSLTGYASGVPRKRWLLDLERETVVQYLNVMRYL